MVGIDWFALIGTVLGGLGVVVSVFVVMRYLQRGGGAPDSKQLGQFRREFEEIKNRMAHESIPTWDEVKSLRQELEIIKKDQTLISDQNRDTIIDSLKDRIKTESANGMLEELEAKVLEKIKATAKHEMIDFQYSLTIERLKEELFSLSKRGNLNLSIGIVTTITGLALLGFFVLGEKPTGLSPGTEQFIINFIPRISLVVLIEVFAYFFLRLYKASLSEIKYFQNEITTIESKYLALKVAASMDDAEQLKVVIEQLVHTERNFILDKGQSTVDLERARIEQQTSSNIIGKLTSLIGKTPNT